MTATIEEMFWQSRALDRFRGHEIITEEIRGQLPVLGSQTDPETGEVPDLPVLLKVFDPGGRGSWYATEFDPETGNCFGFAQSPLGPDCDELGYFNLWELGSITNKRGLPLERDCYWTPCLLSEVQSGEKR